MTLEELMRDLAVELRDKAHKCRIDADYYKYDCDYDARMNKSVAYDDAANSLESALTAFNVATKTV